MQSARNLFSTVRETLLPDPVIDFWCAELGLLHRQRCHLARLTQRTPETADTVSLWLRTTSRYPGFKPGQHINVTAVIKGRRVTRSYSPSSCLHANGRFRITIQKERDGAMSPFLCDELSIGSNLEISPGFGELTLEQANGRLLLLAAGSGITPLSALFSAASEKNRTRMGQSADAVYLMHWAHTGHHALGREMKELADAGDTLTYRALSTDGGDQRIHAGHFTGPLDDLADWTVYACGPDGFVETARQLTAGRCQRFVGEAFTRPRVQPQDQGSVSVYLQRQRRVVELPTHLSILEGLESVGENPAYGCRQGICHTCSCEKTAGISYELGRRGVSDESSATPNLEPGTIQLCTQRPGSRLTLDF